MRLLPTITAVALTFLKLKGNIAGLTLINYCIMIYITIKYTLAFTATINNRNPDMNCITPTPPPHNSL